MITNLLAGVILFTTTNWTTINIERQTNYVASNNIPTITNVVDVSHQVGEVFQHRKATLVLDNIKKEVEMDSNRMTLKELPQQFLTNPVLPSIMFNGCIVYTNYISIPYYTNTYGNMNGL